MNQSNKDVLKSQNPSSLAFLEKLTKVKNTDLINPVKLKNPSG